MCARSTAESFLPLLHTGVETLISFLLCSRHWLLYEMHGQTFFS